MSVLRWVSESAGLQVVGWAVLHSLWQVALIAGLLAVLMRVRGMIMVPR